MSSQLVLTSSLQDGYFLVEGQIQNGSDIPKDIFVYENSGTAELGNYVGVCTLNEFTSLSNYDGTIKPIFGNKFLKHNQVQIKVSLSSDLTSVLNTLKNNVQVFATSFRNSNSIQFTYII